MPLTLLLNGQSRDFPDLPGTTTLDLLISELGLQGDRVAVEHNGVIVPRADWNKTALTDHDRLEMVHFVGGGSQDKNTEAYTLSFKSCDIFRNVSRKRNPRGGFLRLH